MERRGGLTYDRRLAVNTVAWNAFAKGKDLDILKVHMSKKSARYTPIEGAPSRHESRAKHFTLSSDEKRAKAKI